MSTVAGGGGEVRAIDINAFTRRVDVDHRIPLHHYYRIASNLLKQAAIYRAEKNLIDLYIILLRFSSLMCETIPAHRDYQILHQKEKNIFRKKLLDVLNELESLKPVVNRQVDEINRGHMYQLNGQEKNSSGVPAITKQSSPRFPSEQINRGNFQLLREQQGNVSSEQLDRQFQKSLNLLTPKEETLSRHSILGPNGLRGQWMGPAAGIRVQYPNNFDEAKGNNTGWNQAAQQDLHTREEVLRKNSTEMESILSLDDGRWSLPAHDSCSLANESTQDNYLQLNIRQPSPPPVLAEVHSAAIPPSRVADPRPGPAKPLQDGIPDSKGYQNLHIPVKMLESFLRLAEINTAKNLETCGVLAGSLKNRMFFITTLIIPKQESTSDSCQTTDEEEIFDVQDKRSLFPLGWIHTHPTQTCFMSSIDLHTHYSYQVMLPEAIAIVMAPQDTSRKHGIFHLSDPGGISVIRNCQERGFHPHEEPPDGSPIYEHCSHVLMNPNLKFDVIDLRNS